MSAKARMIVGLLGLFIGGVWILQGLNVLPGSFMTGDTKWFFIGLVVAAAGIVLVVSGAGKLRKPK